MQMRLVQCYVIGQFSMQGHPICICKRVVTYGVIPYCHGVWHATCPLVLLIFSCTDRIDTSLDRKMHAVISNADCFLCMHV